MKNSFYSAVEIPYGNGMWNMIVLLPEEGKTIDDVINSISASGIKNGWAICEIEDGVAMMKAYSFSPHEVDLKLPRFETNSDTDGLDINRGLIGLLQKMGINLAFDPSLAEIPNMCERPVYNRPFVYVIRESSSGLILFVGKFTGE